MSRGFDGSANGLYGAGITDKVTTAYTAHATARSYSIWAWRSGFGDGDVAPNGANNQRLWDKRTVSGQFEVIFWDGSGGANNDLFVFVRTWTTGGTWTWTKSPFKAWTNITLTYDGSSTANDPIVYYNGVSQTVTRATAPTGTIQTNTDAYMIGNTGVANRGWDGYLAEFAIWDRILSASEAAALGKGYSPLFFPASLVEYVPMIRDNISRKNAAPTITGTVVQPHLPIIYRSFVAPPRKVPRLPGAVVTASMRDFPKFFMRQPLTQGRLS